MIKEQSTPTQTPGTKLSVLVVDDSSLDRKSIERMLRTEREAPLVVHEAGTILDGLRMYRKFEPDCVLIDHRLRDGQGIELLRMLAEVRAPQPVAVIYLTSHDSERLAVRALKAGAQDFLSKSWLTPETLWRAIDNCLQRVKLARDLAERQRQLENTNRELERTLEALQESQRLKEQIAGLMPSLLYVFDLIEDRNIYSNRSMTHLLGYTSDEVIDMGKGGIQSLVHPEERPVFDAQLARMRAAKNGETHECEYRIRHKDGTWRWLRTRETVFCRADNGVVWQVLGTAEDFTERKLAEEAIVSLNRSLEKRVEGFHQVLEESPVGVAISETPECKRLWLNGTMRKMLELPSDVDAASFAAATNSDPNTMVMRQAVATGRAVRDLECELVGPNGHPIIALLSAQPTFDHELPGSPVRGCLAFCIDITNHRPDEAELTRLKDAAFEKAASQRDEQLRLAREQWRESEARLRGAQEELRQSDERLRTALDQLRQSDERRRLSQELLQEAEDRARAAQEDSARSQSQSLVAEEALRAAREELERSEAEIKALAGETGDSLERIRELTERAAAAQSLLETSRQESELRQTALQQAHAEVVKAQTALDGSQGELVRAQEAVRDTEGRAADLGKRLAEVELRAAEAEARLRALEGDLAEAQEAVSDREAALLIAAGAIDDRDRSLAELTVALGTREAELEKLQKAEAAASKAVEERENRVRQAEQELTEAHARVRTLEGELQFARKAANADVSSLQADADAARSELATLQQSHEQMLAELAEARTRSDADVSSLQADADSARSELVTLQQLHEQMLAELAEARMKSDANVSSLQADADAARSELAALQRSHEKMLAELSDARTRSDADVSSLQADADAARSELAALRSSHEEMLAELSEALMKSDAENESQRRSLTDRLAELTSARETAERLTGERDEAAAKTAELSRELEELQSKREALATEIASLRKSDSGRLTELTETAERLAAERDKAAASVQSLAKEIADLRSERQTMAAEMAAVALERESLTMELSAMREVADSRLAVTDAREAELLDEVARLEQKTKEISAAMALIEGRSASAEKREAAFQAELGGTKWQLERAIEEVRVRSEEASTLDKTLGELTSRYAETEERLRVSTADSERLEAELAANSKELDETRLKLTAAERAAEELGRVKGQLQALTAEHANTVVLLQESESRFQRSEEELRQAEFSLADARKALAEASERLAESRERLRESDERWAEAQRQLPASERALQEAQDQVRQSEKRVRTAEQELAATQAKLATEEETSRNVLARAEEAEGLLATAQAELDESRGAHREAQERLTLVESQLAAEQERNRQLEEEVRVNANLMAKTERRLVESQDRSRYLESIVVASQESLRESETLRRSAQDQLVESEHKLASANQKLRAAEEQYTALSTSLPCTVFSAEPNGRIVSENAYWEEQVGRALKVSEERDWAGAFHPDEEAAAVAAWKTGISKRAPFTFIARVKRKDGAFRWFDFHANPVRNASSNQLEGWTGTAAEIHEQVTLRESLRQARLRYGALLDNAHEFIYFLSPSGLVLGASRRALDVLKDAAEGVVGQPFWETRWWPKSERAKLEDAVRTAAAGELVSYDALQFGTDGQPKKIRLSISPVRDENGQVALLVPLCEDIYQGEAVAVRLRKSEALAASLIDGSTEWVSVVDREGRMVTTNPLSGAAADLTASPTSDGAAWLWFWSNEDREAASGAFQTACEGEPTRFKGRTKSGRSWEVSLSPIRDSEDAIHRVVASARDLTDRSRFEEKMQRMLAEFQSSD